MVLALNICVNSLSNDTPWLLWSQCAGSLWVPRIMKITAGVELFFFQYTSCEVTFLSAFRNQTQLQSLGLGWKPTCIVRPLVIYLYFSVKSLIKWVNGHISLQKIELEVLFLHHSYKFTILFFSSWLWSSRRWCLLPVLPSGTSLLVKLLQQSLCCTMTTYK